MRATVSTGRNGGTTPFWGETSAPATAPAVVTDTGSCSREQLLRAAHGAATQLRDEGVREGDRVAIDPGGALSGLTWLLGADLLGAASLVMEPTWTSRERESVLADVQPATVVSEEPSNGGTVEPAGDEATSFYLPTTSGSSGRPKVLVRSRGSWSRSFESFAIGTAEDDVVLVPGPLSSSLFLFATAHSLHNGLTVRLLERWSPAATAAAAGEATVVHLVPAMLGSLLSVLEREAALRESCTLRKVVCGGARVDGALRRRLATTLPGCELVEYYGSAEHSVVAMRRGDGPLRPVHGVEVRVEDGLLLVRSDLVHSGFVESGTVRAVEPGFSGTGDLASLHQDGSLTVHGRAGAVVSSGGAVVSAEEVESALRRAPGVLDAVVTGSPHERLESVVTAVVEVDPAEPALLPDLRAHARATLAPAKRPRRWLLVRSIPRTASGKAARATVARRLLDGTLGVEEPA